MYIPYWTPNSFFMKSAMSFANIDCVVLTAILALNMKKTRS